MNDKTRFENFFKLLTKSWVKHWTSRLDEGYWTEDDLANFNSYFRYSEEPLSSFSDPALNEKFKKLNRIFSEIGKFFNEYFTLRYKDSYSFRPEIQPNAKEKLHDQLRILIIEFRQIHEELVVSYRDLHSESHREVSSGIKLPQGTRWQEITIQFLNPHEVSIIYNGQRQSATFETLGFENKKSHLPNGQWGLLISLAQKGGQMTWREAAVSSKDQAAFRQRKKNLSDTLRKAFGINDDPFEHFKKENVHRIKIKLIPPPTDDEEFSQEKKKDAFSRDIERELAEMGYPKYESERNSEDD